RDAQLAHALDVREDFLGTFVVIPPTYRAQAPRRHGFRLADYLEVRSMDCPAILTNQNMPVERPGVVMNPVFAIDRKIIATACKSIEECTVTEGAEIKRRVGCRVVLA